MNKRDKTIGIRNAKIAAEKFVLSKYPHTNVAFDRIDLINDGVLQVYELMGYLNLAKWPNSVGIKNLCKIQVNAFNADIVDHHGT
jgi:hypothetical protein